MVDQLQDYSTITSITKPNLVTYVMKYTTKPDQTGRTEVRATIALLVIQQIHI